MTWENLMLFQDQPTPRQQKENIPPAARTTPRAAPEPRRKPSTPEVGLIGKLGSYEKQRQRLQEERKREYNQMIAGVSMW